MESSDKTHNDYCDSDSGVYPPEDFQGLWVEHWSDGQLKYRGQFALGGKRIGQHIAFWYNGNLQEVSYWIDGWVNGTVIIFNEDGSKETEKDFGEHGGRTRNWIERSYHSEGDVWNITTWKNDEIVAEWIHPETQKLFDEIGLDAIVENAVRRVYPEP